MTYQDLLKLVGWVVLLYQRARHMHTSDEHKNKEPYFPTAKDL
ncbi:hypothetical protein KIM372_09290 [Bombiscardovia nodaiensis]|uniref:Uncharacterized protein n=1 Tax=Bombiscardovia nodaiensis TaxID=2932181 RepID=A0ABN6SA43_9BIFI|nr:hypothetical protein KIM372_09290 [Bombiscardovia nodaiensis]